VTADGIGKIRPLGFLGGEAARQDTPRLLFDRSPVPGGADAKASLETFVDSPDGDTRHNLMI